jgi:D-3-phosphoglycerate dehydrogenase
MKRRWKVFINEPIDYYGTTHKLLEENGCEVILGRPIWEHPGWAYTDEELIQECLNVDAVMGASREKYTRKFMESVKNLRVISKYGIGTEKIDVRAATDLGILVANTPVPENVHSVAEHAIGLMLSYSKKLSFSANYAQKGGWRDQNTYTSELFGKTLGIIGFGRIGAATVEKLSGWKMNFLAYDPYKNDKEIKEMGATPVGLEQLLRESDIVSINVVVTDETRNMIGKDQLKLMKKDALIINTARGEVINEPALIEALQEGWIGGAGLDVTDPEPPSIDNPLFNMENVVITPHTAGWSKESQLRITGRATQNLLNALKGELPISLVNPDAVPKWRERLEKIEALEA